MLKDFDALRVRVQGKKSKTIAVAGAQDAHTLEALKELTAQIAARIILVGEAREIEPLRESIGLDLGGGRIVDALGEEEAAAGAVALVASGEADILMKGKIQTGVLLKAALNRETGIRRGGLMSHLAALESPAYSRLMFITDGGINPAPDFEQKKAILENAVDFLRRLGYERPNVAALAAAEAVSDKMPETGDAQRLAALCASGEIAGCAVEGPLSFDLAISPESARVKGVEVKMAGAADIFLAPNISTGNIMSKALLYLGGAKMAGCVLGAKAPIVLTSRGASAEEKFLSFLMTMAVE